MKRQARRTAEELRNDLCTAARDLFARQGYTGTSTRDIAKQAGAVEQLIYKHFHSKAELFGAAVLTPLEAALSRSEQRLDSNLGGIEDAQKALEAFVRSLHSTILSERKLLIAFLGVATFEPNEFPRDGQGSIDKLIQRLRKEEVLGKAFGDAAGLTIEDPMMETRLLISFILSTVLFESIFFEPGEVDHERMERSLLKLLLFGLSGQPAAS